MIKSITNFLIIFFIFQQLKSQISQIDQNGVKPFCDETLQLALRLSLIRCTDFNTGKQPVANISYRVGGGGGMK